ncbi:flavoprotein [Actinoallomurus soli]|uniref:flavoprotein n=1 Tax=Actinoallomurus soli TaxID=2952535 RepID=UPI002092DA93|nr:flavoprotein [Actinoallomurus soli]MCO5967741.1 flavoprotein [Actinoallomurus soli]
MTQEHQGRVLYAIVCGAGPAAEVGRLVDLAQRRGWDVQVVATPSALNFLDVPSLETQTGRPVRSQYRRPEEPRSPKADAIIVAPATYNTMNKCAAGISDNYALGILAEAPGLGIPTVFLPFVNTAMAGRRAFRRSVDELAAENMNVLLGPGGFEPHPPGTGTERIAAFPWQAALRQVEDCFAGHEAR